ncbi:MAG: hypothetical protein ABIS59_01760 [Candidatus Saccharibacteria bacterium]
MSKTILRQIETPISLNALLSLCKTNTPFTVSIGPVPNSKGDADVRLSQRTIVLVSSTEHNGYTEFEGHTSDTKINVTLTHRDVPEPKQDITIELQAA